jgi:hypothetical protein
MRYNSQHRTQFLGRRSGILKGFGNSFADLIGGVKITFEKLFPIWRKDNQQRDCQSSNLF